MKTVCREKDRCIPRFLHSMNWDVAELSTFTKKLGNALRFPNSEKALEISFLLSNIIEIG